MKRRALPDNLFLAISIPSVQPLGSVVRFCTPQNGQNFHRQNARGDVFRPECCIVGTGDKSAVQSLWGLM